MHRHGSQQVMRGCYGNTTKPKSPPNLDLVINAEEVGQTSSFLRSTCFYIICPYHASPDRQTPGVSALTGLAVVIHNFTGVTGDPSGVKVQ